MSNEDLSPAVLSARAVTRRHFFRSGGLGIGAIALQSLLSRDGVLAQGASPRPQRIKSARAQASDDGTTSEAGHLSAHGRFAVAAGAV